MKTIWAGAGLAVTAGMLMGAAMRPDLPGDPRPAGPQMVLNSGGRGSGPFADDGAAPAAYLGKVPDYVLGTDWARPPQQQVASAPPARGAAQSADPAVDIEADAPPEATGDTRPAA